MEFSIFHHVSLWILQKKDHYNETFVIETVFMHIKIDQFDIGENESVHTSSNLSVLYVETSVCLL